MIFLKSKSKVERFLSQLISSVDPKFLKLTKLDDKIYSAFRETFKDLDVKVMKADDLKSDKAKEVRDKNNFTLRGNHTLGPAHVWCYINKD